MATQILNTIGTTYTPAAAGILKQLGEVNCQNLDQNQLLELIPKYNVLLVGLGLNINKEVIDRGQNLKVIATVTTGLDHIDLDAAMARSISVLSLRGENDFLDTISGTAELALGLMINLCRQIHLATQSVQRGEWQRELFRGRSLIGKTLGIVGLGRLGKMMARYGHGLGMNIVFADPNVDSIRFPDYKKLSLDELVVVSDVISLHLHLNNETKGMINGRLFQKMKPTSYIINTSRDGIVNETDLIDALQLKTISGYATDVLSGEVDFGGMVPPDHPLVLYSKNNPNVIIVPHIGGMTVESREATDIFIANKLKKFLFV
ncbi:MAG: NAD(P)-dependent oxidoreductase [Patescibacteria group bacterium]